MTPILFHKECYSVTVFDREENEEYNRYFWSGNSRDVYISSLIGKDSMVERDYLANVIYVLNKSGTRTKYQITLNVIHFYSLSDIQHCPSNVFIYKFKDEIELEENCSDECIVGSDSDQGMIFGLIDQHTPRSIDEVFNDIVITNFDDGNLIALI